MYKWGILCMLTALVAILAIQYYMFEGFTDAAASPAAVALAAPASGSPADGDGSGAAKSAANATDLSGAANIAANALAAPAMPADDATPETTAAGPAAWKQQWSKMLRDIQDVVRGEIRQARMAPVVNGSGSGSGAAKATPATLQGLEHSANCEKDMSQYVRKDSIPCWNCTLDY